MAVRRRNDPVRLLGRRLLLLGLLIASVVGSLGVWSAYQKEQESATLKVEAQQQLDDLSRRQEQLNDDIARLQTDRGKEEVLRDQYALAAQGENVIVIVDPSSAEPTATSTSFAKWFKHTFSWW